ncbi:MAG: flagellar hook capping FlgD N-terminal domain-containing protein [Acidimicrobiales bacterium]
MTIGSAGGVGAQAYTAAPAPAATASAGTTGATGTSAAAKSNMASQLATPNLFLKLLMVELQHQNPTSPTTPSSMLQQTAMLSQVEAITSMTTAIDQQKKDAQAADATSLIGKQVTAVMGATTVSGAVTDVSLTSTGTPTLDVGGTTVPLSAVTKVSAAGTAGTTTSNSTTTA